MTLLRLHAVFIGTAILLCFAFITREMLLVGQASTLRSLAGIGIPALIAGMLIAYLRYLIGKLRRT